MSLLVDDISALVNTNPLVTTNVSGSFNLPYGIFGFGMPFARTSASGSSLDSVYVSHTIQIILYKSGYLTTTKTITIDETNGMIQTFTLTKQ
jgi:hypothetical protein